MKHDLSQRSSTIQTKTHGSLTNIRLFLNQNTSYTRFSDYITGTLWSTFDLSLLGIFHEYIQDNSTLRILRWTPPWFSAMESESWLGCSSWWEMMPKSFFWHFGRRICRRTFSASCPARRPATFWESMPAPLPEGLSLSQHLPQSLPSSGQEIGLKQREGYVRLTMPYIY